MAANCPITREELLRKKELEDECPRCRDFVYNHENRIAQPTQVSTIRQCFQYSCRIYNGRTRRKFCANLFRLAESHSGHIRENFPADGIIKDGKNISISLVFKFESDLYRFQSEVIELLSLFTGHKRPLIEADLSTHPHELILEGQRSEQLSIADTVSLQRIFKFQYQHDSTENDPDNSADCDGYSDISSLYSTFSEYVNITDPGVVAQMIEDPRSVYWNVMSPEAAHIKDKAKCTKHENNDPNNFIYMSRFLHCYFDGLNAKPPRFPYMKIQYVRHDDAMVPCPVVGMDPAPLGLPRRQRVTVRIIFWDSDVRGYAMAFIRGGDIDIDANTREIDLYFQDAKKAMTFLKWKEEQTEKAWHANRQGLSATEFAVAEGISQIELVEDFTSDDV